MPFVFSSSQFYAGAFDKQMNGQGPKHQTDKNAEDGNPKIDVGRHRKIAEGLGGKQRIQNQPLHHVNRIADFAEPDARLCNEESE